MVKKIYKYIQEHRMLENTGILVAGLSGGADSVCLVAVLKEIIEKEQLDIIQIYEKREEYENY